MRAWLLLLAACGGGPSGTLDVTVTDGGASTELSESCELTEGDMYFDMHGGSDDLAFEIKWKKNAITAPGTYTSMGIVSDISIFVLRGTTISSATGTVMFTTYGPPDTVIGTFNLMIPDEAFSAVGVFECR